MGNSLTRKFFIILILIFLVSTSFTFAQTDYKYLGKVNNWKFYYKPIEFQDENSITIWMKIYYDILEAVDENGKKVKVKNGIEVCLMSFDCRYRKYMFRSISSYYPNGKLISQAFPETPAWNIVIPESIADWELNKLCLIFK